MKIEIISDSCLAKLSNLWYYLISVSSQSQAIFAYGLNKILTFSKNPSLKAILMSSTSMLNNKLPHCRADNNIGNCCKPLPKRLHFCGSLR